jgi:hypothetical protein
MGFEVKYGKRSRRGARNQLSILGATAEWTIPGQSRSHFKAGQEPISTAIHALQTWYPNPTGRIVSGFAKFTF